MESKYVYEKPADEKLYEEMRRKSLEGESVKRTGKRYKWNKKKFVRNMAVLIAVTVGVTLAGNHVADKMSKSIQENALYGSLFDNYLEEVFYPATHHVNGTVSDIYLDYDKLADYIDAAEDKDLAISITNSAIVSKNFTDDEEQMNRIISETDLGVDSIDEYLHDNDYNGYEDMEKFTADQKEELMENANSSELDKMTEKEVSNDLEAGGKSL